MELFGDGGGRFGGYGFDGGMDGFNNGAANFSGPAFGKGGDDFSLGGGYIQEDNGVGVFGDAFSGGAIGGGTFDAGQGMQDIGFLPARIAMLFNDCLETDNADDGFKLLGKVVNKIRIVGVVVETAITDQRRSFVLDDGTATIVCDWYEMDEISEYRRHQMDSVCKANVNLVVYGKISLLGNDEPHLQVVVARQTSFDFIQLHHLDVVKNYVSIKYPNGIPNTSPINAMNGGTAPAVSRKPAESPRSLTATQNRNQQNNSLNTSVSKNPDDRFATGVDLNKGPNPLVRNERSAIIRPTTKSPDNSAESQRYKILKKDVLALLEKTRSMGIHNGLETDVIVKRLKTRNEEFADVITKDLTVSMLSELADENQVVQTCNEDTWNSVGS